MYSKTKVHFSRAEIDAVIGAVFTTPVASVQERTDGMFNAAYRVALCGHDPVFLKAAPPDGVSVMT